MRRRSSLCLVACSSTDTSTGAEPGGFALGSPHVYEEGVLTLPLSDVQEEGGRGSRVDLVLLRPVALDILSEGSGASWHDSD